MFNHYLVKMQETGVIERQLQMITPTINRDSYNTLATKEPSGLGYDRVIFPFLALLVGFCIAFVQLGLEAATKYKKKSASNDCPASAEDMTPGRQSTHTRRREKATNYMSRGTQTPEFLFSHNT